MNKKTPTKKTVDKPSEAPTNKTASSEQPSFMAYRAGNNKFVGGSHDLRKATAMVERDPRGGTVVDSQGRVRSRHEPNFVAVRKRHGELVVSAAQKLNAAMATAATALEQAKAEADKIMADASELADWLAEHAPANS